MSFFISILHYNLVFDCKFIWKSYVNFSFIGLIFVVAKDTYLLTHGSVSLQLFLVVWISPRSLEISLENSLDFYLCFQLALFHSASYFFFLCRSPYSLLCTVFDSISTTRDEVLSINPSANVLVFGDFNVHHKDWLTFSTGSDRPGELCYNFSISNDLTQMVNFPTQIPNCDSRSPALLNLFFLLPLVFALQWLSLCWEILVMFLSQFPLTFQ